MKTISQEEEKTAAEKIFARELQRLELSLSQMPKDAILRIALTHYPPIDATLQPSRTSQILENHKIDFCVFGHLHSIDKTKPMFGKIRRGRIYLILLRLLGFCSQTRYRS